MGAVSTIPKIMQVAETVLVSQNECASIWGSEVQITSRMQCAGGQGINSGCQVHLRAFLYIGLEAASASLA